MSGLDAAQKNLLRELAPQVLGAMMKRFGNFYEAEEAVQEALLTAYLKWPEDGLPDNPRGWLIQVAACSYIDELRRTIKRRQREQHLVLMTPQDDGLAPAPDETPEAEPDDTLTLIFMCCHPALTRGSAIALTLRAICGLTTTEIAKAYLVPPKTMAQRISRAKKDIKKSRVPFAMPDEDEREARLTSVTHVLYLMFNEGYASSEGVELQRSDLAGEALRLTRLVHASMPQNCEVAGLLAMMLLTHARRDARTGPRGELIALSQQNRALWDRDAIQEGIAILTSVLPLGGVGGYQLLATISALHSEATSDATTDWLQILAIYELLTQITDNPVVLLNRAVALAKVCGPQAGLDALKPLDEDERLKGHYRLAAVRAHLHEMAGDDAIAAQYYLAAAGGTANLPERQYLSARAARLEGPMTLQ